jgi:hypothetical protein
MSVLTVGPLDILDCLEINGFASGSIHLLDDKYVLPTPESIEEFAKRYGNFLWSANLQNAIENVWDCDKFAIMAKSMANVDNAIWRKQTDNLNCGLAFGVCFVHTENGGHAINMSILQDSDGKLGVHYYEPQFQTTDSGLNLCLTEKSRDSFLQPFFCFV